MSIFRLPNGICISTDSIVRIFYWIGILNKNHYLALISWNKICLSNDYGGLGIRKFEDFNITMLAKATWDI